MAYPKSHNPFADDDDEEDFKPKSRGFDDDHYDGLSDAEKRQRYLQQEAMRTAQSAQDSTNNSIRLLYESEKMGIETAEVCQTNLIYPDKQKKDCLQECASQQRNSWEFLLCLSFFSSLCLRRS